MDRKALVIGIDDYPINPLSCCVNDANKIAELLQLNGDEQKSKNCDVELLTSDDGDVSNAGLQDAIEQFFNSSNRVETAVLYFAGHGIINPGTDTGHLVGTDGRKGAWGMALSELLELANNAHETIASTVIILDCCHAGHLGKSTGSKASEVAQIGAGVTILTSCNTDQKALEAGQHGLFTDLLLDALGGGCADIRGNITPASIYSHIDQVLGAHEQRPLYKANVQRFVTLRKVEPRIPADVLARLPKHFLDPAEDVPLTPQHEPDRKNVPEQFRHLPIDEVKVAAFKDLQKYNRQGLVVPVDADHMYDAAMNSTACRLTPLGMHYRLLAEKDQRISIRKRSAVK